MEYMEYIEVSRARMEPDVYYGSNCDQHRPRWIVSVPKEGDEDMGDILELEAKNFPPGTQVIIQSPVCPKCGEIYEICNIESDRSCDFDWKKWAEDKYS